MSPFPILSQHPDKIQLRKTAGLEKPLDDVVPMANRFPGAREIAAQAWASISRANPFQVERGKPKESPSLWELSN